MRFVVTVLLVACNAADTGVDDPAGDTATADTASEDTAVVTDTGPFDTGDPDPDPVTDADRLREALADGHPDLGGLLHEVAWAGGFPVDAGAGTWLFVAADDGLGAWSLAGDFNGWTPEPMTAGEGAWWAEVAIPDPAGVRYKLVRDDSWILDPLARSFEYDAFGPIGFVAPPDDRARLDRWPDLSGQGLAARDVVALVPPGAGPWPTLYVHDGQNLFDPAAFFGGWHLQDAAAAQDAEVLVVGIANTAARMDEYTHTPDSIGSGLVGGAGDDYAVLLEEDLRPHVEGVYGAGPTTGVAGSSLGGLISLYIGLEYPDRYDFVASMSGTLGWGRFGTSNPTVEELYLAADERPRVLYVDSGGSDGGDGCTDPDGDGYPEDDPNASDNFCTSRQFADAMAADGYVWNDTLFHWHTPGASHNEAAWAERAPAVLERFLDVSP